MLKTRLILPLAFASVAFMYGCQEQGSSPVGPNADAVVANLDHKGRPHGRPKGDDPDPAPTSTLDFAGGMKTTGFEVTVTERNNLLKADNTDFLHPIEMNFTAPGTCEGFKGTKSGVLPSTEPAEDEALSEFDKLVSELTSPVAGGFFTMKVDKIGLVPEGDATTSDIHFLDVERDGTFDGDAGSTRILLGSPFNQVGPVTVKWVSSNFDPDVDVFEFTGPVVVWASKVGGGGGAKSDRIIYCPGTGDQPNLVTVTVNR